jgi:hypothetical protein
MLAAKLGWSFDPPPEPAPAEGSAPDADPDAERGPDTQN